MFNRQFLHCTCGGQKSFSLESVKTLALRKTNIHRVDIRTMLMLLFRTGLVFLYRNTSKLMALFVSKLMC